MKFWNILIVTIGLFAYSRVLADTAIDAPNRYTVGLQLKETTYKATEEFKVEGQILEGGYKLGINPKMSIGGGVGLMFDGNIGGGIQAANGGSGFRLFSDGQYEAHRFDRNKVLLTAAFSFDRFSFSEAGTDADFTTTDVKLGSLILHYFQGFSVYGGVELFLYSSGQFNYGDTTADSKRKTIFNLRTGGSYKLSKKLALRGDLLLMGEQTIFFACDFAI